MPNISPRNSSFLCTLWHVSCILVQAYHFLIPYVGCFLEYFLVFPLIDFVLFDPPGPAFCFDAQWMLYIISSFTTKWFCFLLMCSLSLTVFFLHPKACFPLSDSLKADLFQLETDPGFFVVPTLSFPPTSKALVPAPLLCLCFGNCFPFLHFVFPFFELPPPHPPSAPPTHQFELTDLYLRPLLRSCPTLPSIVSHTTPPVSVSSSTILVRYSQSHCFSLMNPFLSSFLSSCRGSSAELVSFFLFSLLLLLVVFFCCIYGSSVFFFWISSFLAFPLLASKHGFEFFLPYTICDSSSLPFLSMFLMPPPEVPSVHCLDFCHSRHPQNLLVRR